jgi:hypothetical protein
VKTRGPEGSHQEPVGADPGRGDHPPMARFETDREEQATAAARDGSFRGPRSTWDAQYTLPVADGMR